MVRITDVNLPQTTPKPVTVGQDGWGRGVITLIDQSDLPKDALARALNIMLAEDGNPKPRWGVDWFGTAASAGDAIDGAGVHETSAGAVHLWKVVDRTFYRSTDDGVTWSSCGGSFTAGEKFDSVQIGGYTYITNGTDAIARYDGTTTLVSYTAVDDPSSAITGAATGMSGAGFNYYYTYSDVNDIGFTDSAPLSSAIAVTKTRDRWDSSNYVTLTIPAAGAGATRRDIFIATSTTEDPIYITSVPAASTTYVDDGSAPLVIGVTAPTANTTTGPTGKNIAVVNNRIWVTNDTANPQRVWWSGSGTYLGAFTTSYDGSWIDLEPGSQIHPRTVKDYRDGKGTPYATVWCDTPDGLGCIWQISLDTQTIGTTSFTVPNAYKLPGSRGTNAPFSVTSVLNDYYFFNSQAFYNLGSRAQFLNLLSTDEASGNIRSTMRTINASASDKIAAYYYDGKWFVSVPYTTSTTNNYTIVLDTEKKQKPWLPEAFSLGFERFFPYTDTSGERHLLAWKSGDDTLSEISPDILGDYGAAFDTELKSGLISVTSNDRFGWMEVEEGEIEFSNTSGKLYIELAGIDRNHGLRTQKSVVLNSSSVVNIGYDNVLYDDAVYDDTSVTATPYSEPSVKRYFRVNKELNSFQFRIITNTKNAGYTLRVWQIIGTPSQGDPPRQWKLT